MKLLRPGAANNVRRVFATAMGISDTDVRTAVIPEIAEMLAKGTVHYTVNNKLSCWALFGEYWRTLSRG